jgi:hypothetical protein
MVGWDSQIQCAGLIRAHRPSSRHSLGLGVDGETEGASGSKKRSRVEGGGSSTAPKGAREGPASLFTADRREPFTQEPVGAPLEVLSSPLQRNGAMWCINNRASCTSGGGGRIRTQSTSPRSLPAR